MTVDTEQSSIVFTGIVDGVGCAIPFPVQDETELVVRYDDDGTDTVATRGVHYSVTLDPPDYETATVTPLTGFTVISGGTISVRREIPYLQPTDIPTLASLATGRVEQLFDRAVFLAQQLRDKLAYVLQFPSTDDPDDNIATLPNAADRALKYLSFDADGKPVASAGPTSTGTTFTAFGEAWVALANALAGRGALGVYSTTQVDAIGDAKIPKSLLTTIGDIIYASGVSTPARLGIGSAGQLLGLAAGAPAWKGLTLVPQVFTGAGTYTPTAGMVCGIAIGVGNGGGGGGVQGDVGWISEAAGGGSGGLAWKFFTAADIGASKAVTFGAIGAGGLAGTNDGTAGGDVALGALLVAKGASGGQYTDAGAQVGVGGLGGVAGTGDFTATGSPGGSGFTLNSALGTSRGAPGGNSFFGGGGVAAIRTIAGATAGNAGTNYGGGGGGGVALDSAGTAAGGAGATGVLLILQLCVA